MTRDEAVRKLVETRKLYTDMLKPLGVTFEQFLQFAQMSDTAQERAIGRLIEKLSNQR